MDSNIPSQQKLQYYGNANRVQVRGFPKIWTDELTFDEIAWYLFDLLGKYGPVDNITISQCKKDNVIYGVVDMLQNDSLENMIGLEGNNKLPIPIWGRGATLSFRRINPNPSTSKAAEENKSEASKGSSNDRILRNTNAGKSHTNNASAVIDKGPITPPLTASEDSSVACSQSNSQMSTKGVASTEGTRICYNCEQILAIRESSANIKCELDPQFDQITLKTANKIDPLPRMNTEKAQRGNGNRGGGTSREKFNSRVYYGKVPNESRNQKPYSSNNRPPGWVD